MNADAECFIPASEMCDNYVNMSATVYLNDSLKNFRTAQSTDKIDAQSSQLNVLLLRPPHAMIYHIPSAFLCPSDGTLNGAPCRGLQPPCYAKDRFTGF